MSWHVKKKITSLCIYDKSFILLPYFRLISLYIFHAMKTALTNRHGNHCSENENAGANEEFVYITLETCKHKTTDQIVAVYRLCK